MAIDKIGKRSAVVWNRTSSTYIGVAAGLALISLIFFWLATKNYMIRSNYLEALMKHDSNRRADVKSAADRARSWGRHAQSKELYAKALMDANQVDAAEKIYNEIANSDRMAMGQAGLGFVLLRKADTEKDDKKAADFARKAKERFTQAKGSDSSLIEAQIGAATSDLVLGLRSKDEGKVLAARADFLKIYKQLTGSDTLAATVTREGYVDLYVGLARSHASLTKYNPDALGYASAARRYLPTSSPLFAMELALQAQKMTERPDTPADIKALKLYEKLKKLGTDINNAKNQKDMEDVADAWQAMTMATGAALARGEAPKESAEIFDLASTMKGRNPLMVEVLEASLAMSDAVAPEENASNRASKTNRALTQLKKVLEMKEMQDSDHALLRAKFLNNQAVLEADAAADADSDQKYGLAVNTLMKALEAEKQTGIAAIADGSYEVRRNLAVIQKRRGQADAAVHFAAAQRAASARNEEAVKTDLEKLTRYIAGSP